MIKINSSTLNDNKRIIGLDLIRTIAILIVVAGHGALLIPVEYRKMYNMLFFIDGVNIFFVLSGYLIGNILFRYLKKNSFQAFELVNFWKRRWIRTLPNYYFVLLILVFIDFRNWNYNYSYLFFLQNFKSPISKFFEVSWSLSVEEWFYLIFPFSVYLTLLKVHSKKNMIKITLFLLIIFFLITFCVLRYFKLSNGIINYDEEVRKVVVYRLDSIVWGILGAYFYNYIPDWWNKSRIILMVCSTVLVFILFSLHTGHISNVNNNLSESLIFKSIFSFSIESLAVLFSLPFLSSLNAFKFDFLNKLITLISKISYSLYLLHASVILWIIIPKVDNVLTMYNINFVVNRLILNSLYWGLSICLSYLLFKYFETPILRYRDKITVKE